MTVGLTRLLLFAFASQVATCACSAPVEDVTPSGNKIGVEASTHQAFASYSRPVPLPELWESDAQGFWLPVGANCTREMQSFIACDGGLILEVLRYGTHGRPSDLLLQPNTEAETYIAVDWQAAQ